MRQGPLLLLKEHKRPKKDPRTKQESMVRKSVDELEDAKKHRPYETMKLIQAVVDDPNNKIQPFFTSGEVSLRDALEDAFDDCASLCQSYASLEACLASYCPFWFQNNATGGYQAIEATEEEKMEEFENFSEILEDVLSYTQNVALFHPSNVLGRIKGMIERTL